MALRSRWVVGKQFRSIPFHSELGLRTRGPAHTQVAAFLRSQRLFHHHPVAMSLLASPLEIRTQLGSALGKDGLPYWNKLRDFLIGKLGRVEFEELVRQWINTPELGKSDAPECSDKYADNPYQSISITPLYAPFCTKRHYHPSKRTPSPLCRGLRGRNANSYRTKIHLRVSINGSLVWGKPKELGSGAPL